MNWKMLEAYIPVGEKNAIHMKDLAKLLGVTAEGAKEIVRMARPEAEKDGKIIASTSRGYFIPEGKEELEHYYLIMRQQALTRLKTVRTVRKLLREAD